MRVLRVYHGGRDPSHRARDRALAASGTDLVLVIPAFWPEGTSEAADPDEYFSVIQLVVSRAGDVNRHSYRNRDEIEKALREWKPDLLDIHEEPFSVASRQWLAAAPASLPVVMYSAQNIDKRFPPPYARYETAAHQRVQALYPCSAQAASVSRGKGFAGLIDVLPLGYDDAIFTPGVQSLDVAELVLVLAGRLVPEKGVTDGVGILARVNATRPARLVVVGSGPEEASARQRAAALGVTDRVEIVPWQSSAGLAATYRSAHFLLVPSRPTESWVEQFGRVIVEAQASGAVVAGYASGAIPEVAGDTAVLTEVGKASGLADRLVSLVDDPADYERRRQAGLALSRTRTWTQVAARQADLYRRVLTGGVARADLPRSPRARRAAARAEFGPTAATTAGMRPFALPVLRRGGAVMSALGAVLDQGAELAARVRRA